MQGPGYVVKMNNNNMIFLFFPVKRLKTQLLLFHTYYITATKKNAVRIFIV